ncbi:hypothetical protein ACK8GG_17195 [Micromonosporaceae bacterium DT55]|uniref:hypothetical protein n=1 Tax=Melissospora conviva TaxID=3388432 RepID=UPI003C1E23BD
MLLSVAGSAAPPAVPEVSMPAQVAVGEQELYALSEEHPVTVANAGAVPVQVTAAPPGRCYDDAVQIAPPAYGYDGGLRALSVRQYWSPTCRAVMGYVWVWKQYRDNAMLDDGTWRVRLAVRPAGGARGNGVAEHVQGQPHELWTVPFTPGAGCTVVTATLTHRRTGESMTATTKPWCG